MLNEKLKTNDSMASYLSKFGIINMSMDTLLKLAWYYNLAFHELNLPDPTWDLELDNHVFCLAWRHTIGKINKKWHRFQPWFLQQPKPVQQYQMTPTK